MPLIQRFQVPFITNFCPRLHSCGTRLKGNLYSIPDHGLYSNCEIGSIVRIELFLNKTQLILLADNVTLYRLNIFFNWLQFLSLSITKNQTFLFILQCRFFQCTFGSECREANLSDYISSIRYSSSSVFIVPACICRLEFLQLQEVLQKQIRNPHQEVSKRASQVFIQLTLWDMELSYLLGLLGGMLLVEISFIFIPLVTIFCTN